MKLSYEVVVAQHSQERISNDCVSQKAPHQQNKIKESKWIFNLNDHVTELNRLDEMEVKLCERDDLIFFILRDDQRMEPKKE
jgi:hypothetical protein